MIALVLLVVIVLGATIISGPLGGLAVLGGAGATYYVNHR